MATAVDRAIVGWYFCPSHYRLCPRFDWVKYQSVVGEIVREQWAERALIQHWLDLVLASHRDLYTIGYLEYCLRLNRWTTRDLDKARSLEHVKLTD